MNTTAAFLTGLLLFITVQGHPAGGSSRCHCSNSFFRPNRGFLLSMKVKPSVHPPSTFCPQVEIILTSAAGQKKCLDPKSKLGQKFLSDDRRAQRGAASTAVASSQTPTQSSAWPNTTANQKL